MNDQREEFAAMCYLQGDSDEARVDVPLPERCRHVTHVACGPCDVRAVGGGLNTVRAALEISTSSDWTD